MVPDAVSAWGDSGLLTLWVGDSGLPRGRFNRSCHVSTMVPGTVKGPGFLTMAPVWMGASLSSRLGIAVGFWATGLLEIPPRLPHQRLAYFFLAYC